MSFATFRDKLNEQLAKMVEGSSRLFIVNLDKDEMWNLYLDSFPDGTNNIYRERREHDCSCCRQFIKGLGGVVAIKDGMMSTIWDVITNDDIYQPVADALSDYIKSKPVCDVFFCKEKKIGTSHNFEQLADGTSKKWEHFCADVPAIAYEGRRSIGDIQSDFRATKDVFKRSLDEITEDSITTVLELIAQNSLYRGAEWKNQLTTFLEYKRKYMGLLDDKIKV